MPLPPLPSRRQICISFRGRRRRRRRRRSRVGSNFILRLSVPTSFPRACAKFMSGLPPSLSIPPLSQTTISEAISGTCNHAKFSLAASQQRGERGHPLKCTTRLHESPHWKHSNRTSTAFDPDILRKLGKRLLDIADKLQGEI